MLAIPVVSRNGVSGLLNNTDLVATNEPVDLSTNTANPTEITAEQLIAADFLFVDPGTVKNVVLLPSAEEIILEILKLDPSGNGNGCNQITNTTAWASHVPLVSACGACPEGSSRLLEGYSFRRTFYRNELDFETPIYLEIDQIGPQGLKWDLTLENIGVDEETPIPLPAVHFINHQWKTIVFWILNSSPQQSLVGDATDGENTIQCDPALIAQVTVGMRLYTADNTVFISLRGQQKVTAVDYFNGIITVNLPAISSQENLSFTLTPDIKMMPAQSGVLDQGIIRTWWEFWLTDDGSNATELATTGFKCTDRPPPFRLVPGILPRLSCLTPPTDGPVIVDILFGSTGGAGGVSIFTIPLHIDEGQRTSKTAASPAMLANHPTEIEDDLEVTYLVTDASAGVKGLKVKLYVDIFPVAADFEVP